MHNLQSYRGPTRRTLCPFFFLLASCADGSDDPIEARQGVNPVVVSFQDGQLPTSAYSGTRDTMLEGSAPTTKNGSDTSLSVEAATKRLSLLSWDLSGMVPPGAAVESVSLALEVSDKSPEVFNLYAAKRAWHEDQATWKVFASGSNWQSGGAAGANDRGSTVLGSFSAPATGAATITLNAAGVAVVQAWVDEPASNHGFIVDGPGTSNRLEFRASEYGTKSQRPKLTVTWHETAPADTTGAPDTGDGDTGEVTLNPTPGFYKQTCDGSFGVALGNDYFVDGNDEDQGLRVYLRGANAGAVKTVDISASLGLASADEADLEDAARIGDRIYVVSSHGRNKSGQLERMRHRFFAVDIAGTAPAVSFTTAGYTSTLLDELLKSSNWVSPDLTVIATLTAAANLGKATDVNLAPKVNGINIEGLAWLPTVQRPKQLVLGFRNPLQGADAILVSLLNADAVVTGAKPQFGEATRLGLGGLRVRGMAWSPLHAAMLILAGPKDAGAPGPFRLYRWSGVPGASPVLVTQILDWPADSGPEAIVVHPNTRDMQVLFDQGEHLIGGATCKDSAASSRSFSDVIIHVP